MWQNCRALLAYGLVFYSEHEMEKFILDYCDIETMRESIRESLNHGSDLQDAVGGLWWSIIPLGHRRGFVLGRRIVCEQGQFDESLSIAKTLWRSTFPLILAEVISEVEVY